MKYDIKTIIILVLLGFTIILGYKWYFSGDDVSKEKVKQLEIENKKLEFDKKNSDIEINRWKVKFTDLDITDKKLKLEVSKSIKDAKDALIKANKSKLDLDNLQKGLNETRRKIEEFEKNPPNRTGDALLESIKNRTK
jgi:predicted negative regulator of RcsB-dependent stress response